MFWKSVILFLSGLCLASAVQAQPDTLWTRTYSSGTTEWSRGVIETNDGGYIVAGHSGWFDTGAWLSKTDQNGDTLWFRRFDDAACRSIASLADGRFAVTGTRQGKFWLLVADENGDSLWSRTYGEIENYSCGFSLVTTRDGGFAIAGITYLINRGQPDFLIVKIGENGDSLWSRTYGGDSSDECYSMIETSDGGFALAGMTRSYGAGGRDYWLVRTDEEGDTLWTKTYGGASSEGCNSMVQTGDGGFALAGYSRTFGASSNSMWLLKTNNTGDSLWSSTYGGQNNTYCVSLIELSDGGFSLAGDIYSEEESSPDFLLLRADELGNELWSTSFQRDGHDACFTHLQSADRGFVLVGYADSSGENGADTYIVKTTPDPVSVSNTGSVPYPTSLDLLSPYPNPFNSTVSVGFRTAKPGLYALDVIDPQGRSLGVISQGYQLAGERRLVWNADGLPGGNYWLRLTDAQGGHDVRPIVLVK